MMNKSLMEEAEYMDILVSLLQSPYNIESLTKLVFISFCVHSEKDISKYLNRKKDFVDTFIENVSLKLEVHKNELKSIFKVLNILCQQNIISIEGDKITLIREVETETQNVLIQKCSMRDLNPITEVNKLDAKALLEEVIRYV